MPGTGRSAIAARRRVAIVAADAGRLLRFRTPLLKAIAGRGNLVLCLTGQGSPADVEALRSLGVAHAPAPMKTGGLRVLADRAAISHLRGALTDWGPNVVLGIGLKPMVLAAVASRRLEAVRIVLVATSLAGLAARSSERRETVPFGERWLLRRALDHADALVCHNAEEEGVLRRLGVLPPGLAVHVQPGAGVDLERFAAQPMPGIADGLVFTMIASRNPPEGLAAFSEAAQRTKARVPKSRFVLMVDDKQGAGAAGFDPARLPREVEFVESGDPVALLAATHVFVLPSCRDGFAQIVAEALACGRPAITCDTAGCRDIVDERVSGVLVPAGDAGALGHAFDSFLRRPEDIAWMGQAARRKAERRFDVRAINAKLLEMMHLGGDA